MNPRCLNSWCGLFLTFPLFGSRGQGWGEAILSSLLPHSPHTPGHPTVSMADALDRWVQSCPPRGAHPGNSTSVAHLSLPLGPLVPPSSPHSPLIFYLVITPSQGRARYMELLYQPLLGAHKEVWGWGGVWVPSAQA